MRPPCISWAGFALVLEKVVSKGGWETIDTGNFIAAWA